MLKKITNVLFILTIICLPISIIVAMIFDPFFSFFFLPIPLLLLAITLLVKYNRYKNVKIDYNTNIAFSIIVTFLISVVGFYYYLPRASLVELKPDYAEITQVELPTNTFMVSTYKTIYKDEKETERWNYEYTEYNIGMLDAKRFEEEIKSSDVWILNPKLDSSYINDRPIELETNKNTYVLNYHFSTKEYNEYSVEDGRNIIITYDTSKRHIEIHDYYYGKLNKKRNK